MRVDYFELSRFGNTDDSSSFLVYKFLFGCKYFPSALALIVIIIQE